MDAAKTCLRLGENKPEVRQRVRQRNISDSEIVWSWRITVRDCIPVGVGVSYRRVPRQTETNPPKGFKNEKKTEILDKRLRFLKRLAMAKLDLIILHTFPSVYVLYIRNFDNFHILLCNTIDVLLIFCNCNCVSVNKSIDIILTVCRRLSDLAINF